MDLVVVQLIEIDFSVLLIVAYTQNVSEIKTFKVHTYRKRISVNDSVVLAISKIAVNYQNMW